MTKSKEDKTEEDFFDQGLVGEAATEELDSVGSSEGVLQMQTKYATARSVIKPRDSNVIAVRLKDEARRSGESFFYGWGSGKDRILGPSINLAQAAARCYGNNAIEMGSVQETEDAWIFTASFIDLETGFTMGRQFRQSKNWTVYGKHDQDRKDDIRFQIGQSKAIRNVILGAIPKWIISGAITEAQKGVRERVLKFIKAKGIAAAQLMMINQLKRHGVREVDILNKCQVKDVTAIDEEMIVLLRGDLYALDSGMDHAVELFPTIHKDANTGSGSIDNVSGNDAAFGDSGSAEAEDAKKNSKEPPKAVTQAEAAADAAAAKKVNDEEPF